MRWGIARGKGTIVGTCDDNTEVRVRWDEDRREADSELDKLRTFAGSSAGPTARSSCRSRPCRSACASQWSRLPSGSSVSANAGMGRVQREGIDEGRSEIR